MKKTEIIKKLSDLTKISADKLTEVFTSEAEDFELEFPEVHVYSDDELESFKKNMTREAAKTAIEMAVKEQRNKLVEQFGEDFNFQGKTIENLLEYSMKAGEKKAGVKPNEQLAEKDKIINALKTSVQALEAEKVQVVNEKNQILLDYDLNSTITRVIPSDIETIWTKDEIATLFKNNYQIVVEDGKKMVKKDGEILRDKKTQDPLQVETVVNDWLLGKGITSQPKKGRGGSDDKGKPTEINDFKSVDDIVTYAQEKGLSNEQQVELTRKFFKDNPNAGL